ncbi:MAG TPA: DUF4407 domain-containing protein [Flavobacterium sp.]|uniref:DUF4407 domain-containing protein n=1 Tax=Flavobacterium sp. TaxID=239 RepID=UPI002B4B2789|nr:DUF4407 domain-containing protein [Flavobacterium sp.]HLO73046.1 DUF4407 domain-containing protein [Flavobacterium sp.]
MNKTANSFRLFLCTFSGEDNFIIKKCSLSIQIIFASIGVFVIAVFIGCFISAYEFFHSLFQSNSFISIPIGITWAMLVTNMYLLLLYTVSPALLPTKNNRNEKKNEFFTTSMFFRISFMSLLAIIIAQPLNVLFFNNSIGTSLKKHIQEEKIKMITIADSLLIKNEVTLFQDFNNQVKLSCNNYEIDKIQTNLSIIEAKINSDKVFINQSKKKLSELTKLDNKVWLNNKEDISKNRLLNELSVLTEEEISSDENFLTEVEKVQISNQFLLKEFVKYKKNLKDAINKKIEIYNKLDYLLSQSNFYIKRIQLILFENPFSWITTIVVCLLFLLPIYVKYKVRDKTGFYDQKIDLEKRIVLDEYSKFKMNYSKLLQRNIVKYNYKSLDELKDLLSKLSIVNKKNFKIIEKHIKEEYKEEVVSKYEYWADNPFRTINKFDHKNLAKEEDFLKTIYPEKV